MSMTTQQGGTPVDADDSDERANTGPILHIWEINADHRNPDHCAINWSTPTGVETYPEEDGADLSLEEAVAWAIQKQLDFNVHRYNRDTS